jgi:hypothetical protein
VGKQLIIDDALRLHEARRLTTEISRLADIVAGRLALTGELPDLLPDLYAAVEELKANALNWPKSTPSKRKAPRRPSRVGVNGRK